MACREAAARDDLVRLALGPGGQVVVDFRAKLPGRGAWAHPGCLSELRAGALRKAFGVDVDPAALLASFRAHLSAALLDGISLAAAGGALVGGHDLLAAALREGRTPIVIVASDASERTIASLRSASPEGVAFVVVPFDRDALGARTGRGPRAALGVTSSRAASHLRAQLRRLQGLG